MNRFDLSRLADALPNRAARRFAFFESRRIARRQRRGQALILAVLVMLMIALVSAGFLVVVSGNMNQTARVGDKSRAVEAARSGLRYVGEQLTYSRLGENWRPGFKTTGNAIQDSKFLGDGESLMPQAGALSYNLYYTSVDRANGWAGTFAKFPDPLAPRTDAPQYLARVQRIPGELDAGDPDASDPTKQGALKITIIGLSPDDPAAFHKTVAYKGGQNAPLGRFMRTVTNWDFKNKVVPTATADYNNATQILTVSNVRGNFPAVPFTLMIGDAGSADLQSAVVDSVLAAGQVHLATDPFGKTLTGVRVELAAQLGASLPIGITSNDSAIDYNLDGTIAGDKSENTTLAVSNNTNAGSVRVNGGLSLLGGVLLPDLDATAGTTVRVSGLLVQSAPTTDSKATISTSAAPATPIDLANGSNAANFPGAGVSADLVADGADRLQNNPAGDRSVAPFTPPDFASGAGVLRYRELTRDSKSTVTGQPEAANYGYGEGLYINNPSDRERVYDTVTNKLRDMTQPELVKMWLSRQADGSDDTSARFNRVGTPAVATATDASLEEEHLRGWAGPDEFHARGALVELFNDPSDGNAPKIAVTLDSRADNSTAAPNNSQGAVPAKAWRDATGATQTGVYRRVFAWPTNGVIFAEGNVRVRGEVTGVPRSLTIVSQNNIYIDGSIGTTGLAPKTPKVLLLARKNVVANPTAAIFRPDVQTVASSDVTLTAGSTTALPVADAGNFKIGDIVETAPATAPATPSTVAVVQNLTGNTLSLTPLAAGAITNGDIVRSRADTVVNGRSVIASSVDSIQRRLQVSDAANFRLTFDHSADQVKALTIGTEAEPGLSPSADPIYWTNKRATDASGNVVAGEKVARGQFTSPATGTDQFPTTIPSDNATANGNTVAAMVTAINGAAAHEDAPPTIGWKYTAAAVAGYNGVPFHYLAAIRNRQTFGAPATPTTARSVDIKDTPYDMILATSVTPSWNGASIALAGFEATPDTAHTSYAFGFCPDFTDPTTIPGTAEDGLTSDESFYHTDPRQTTLDSRSVPGATTGVNALTLRQSAGLVGISSAAPLPQYRMGHLKMEKMDAATKDATPGYTMNINAFVYAQTGSWFVIPNVRFDKTQFQDSSGNSIFDTVGAKDLNRNGVDDAGEAEALLRYARANYRINFVGAITENQTALVNPAGAFPGAVQAWSNDWASYNENSGTVTNPVAGVNYTFDPSYQNGSLFGDEGFVMPQSNELTYVD
ncbi:hypothetical protein IAD21_05311 [Abditibacteriota bacterium]|nr:hypothetical protein IAD21_05311 [Abditibacteriota bacterium]